MRSYQSIDIPKRISLADQAAAGIRKAIEEGAWADYLPSERRLCEIFQVSRPTIRSALRSLSKSGWFDIRQGRRTRLLPQHRRAAAAPSRLIGLIMQEDISHVTPSSYQLVSKMQALLAEHGFSVEILVCQAASPRAQRRKLESFLRQYRVACCVLLSVSTNLKRWFAERNFPALVLGSCDASVQLPSIDIDFRSICRHAAGVFLRHGHRRIALVLPNTHIGGDLASEQGFEEAVAQWNLTAKEPARALIVHHNGTAQNITSRLDALFNTPHAPTGILVVKPLYVYVVIIYLLQRGLSVPNTVSLIARDQDHVFEMVNPPITHYKYQSDVFVHRLIRLTLKLINQGSLKPEASLLFPDFVKGGTCKDHAP